MMTASSSASVSAVSNADERSSMAVQRSVSFARWSTSPRVSTVSSAGRSAARTASRSAASTTQATASQSPRRCSTASGPNSSDSGTDTAPIFQAARCATSVSGRWLRFTPTRSPRSTPSAARWFASRLAARSSRQNVHTS